MKIPFSLNREYVPEWNGNRELPEDEQIKAVIQTINNADFMLLGDAFKRAGLEGEVDTSEIAPGDGKVLFDEVGRLLPGYVTLEGLFDEDGNTIDISTVSSYPDFIPLAVELLLQLANMATPDEEDVKN